MRMKFTLLIILIILCGDSVGYKRPISPSANGNADYAKRHDMAEVTITGLREPSGSLYT